MYSHDLIRFRCDFFLLLTGRWQIFTFRFTQRGGKYFDFFIHEKHNTLFLKGLPSESIMYSQETLFLLCFCPPESTTNMPNLVGNPSPSSFYSCTTPALSVPHRASAFFGCAGLGDGGRGSTLSYKGWRCSSEQTPPDWATREWQGRFTSLLLHWRNQNHTGPTETRECFFALLKLGSLSTFY